MYYNRKYSFKYTIYNTSYIHDESFTSVDSEFSQISGCCIGKHELDYLCQPFHFINNEHKRTVNTL